MRALGVIHKHPLASQSYRRASTLPATDFIVIGAGSAGCVLANRLTADGKNSVLLLESGKKDHGTWDSWKIQMPSALTYNLANNKYNWDFWTEPQAHLNQRRLHQPRGKVLGGSSSLNAMVYIRGHALDYERWEKEFGVRDWGYRHCLPYFRKAQCHMLGGNQYRGGDGPLYVSRGWYNNELNHAFVKAGVEAGYPYTDDLNGYQQEGFGPMDMTVGKDGTRCSAAVAYLKPAMKRKNLTVKTESHITKVLFEGTNVPKAVGVEYIDSQNNVQRVYAKEEVIVSLGAFGSPHVMMLSGVGPADELAKHGIHVTIDSPNVGANLQDHIDTYVQVLCKKPVSLYPYATLRQPWYPVSAALQWLVQGNGVCASNQFEVGGFIRSRAGIQHPDIQYHFIPACVVGQLEVLPQHGYQVHCSTMRPLSTGFVKLRSRDPRDSLIIDPKFMSHPQDMVDLRNGLRLTFEILNQNALASYRSDRYSPIANVNVDNDAELDEWIRNGSHSAYHPSCTMAMGSVVDHSGRLLGASQLRVVDASIMPCVVSGNLNAPTIMIAEKMADAILETSPMLVDSEEDAKFYVADNWDTQQR